MHAQQNDTQTSHLNWAGAHFSDRLATQNHHPDHLKYPPKATKQCHLPKSENQTLNFNTTYHFTQSAQSASLHITLPLRKSEAPHTLSGVSRRFLYRNSSSCTWRDSRGVWEGLRRDGFRLTSAVWSVIVIKGTCIDTMNLLHRIFTHRRLRLPQSALGLHASSAPRTHTTIHF